MNAQQQVVKRRVKKRYTAPVDSQWHKQWSLVSLVMDSILFVSMNSPM